MNITAQQIFDECKATAGLLELQGNAAATVQAIAAFQQSKKGDLVCAPDPKALKVALEQGASVVVVPGKLDLNGQTLGKEACLILCSNVGFAHAKIKQQYGDHDHSRAGWGRIHPSAIVHESVIIPKDAVLGPNVVIAQGARLGPTCHIMANAVVEHNAVIGARVRIHPGTIIGWECVIGDDSMILSNSVIGGEGFGYVQDQQFNHHRIPQTGNVEIGRKVTIGCNCTIDRGTYGPTRIGDGCIFDNQSHVAHNVTMGQNCIIISGTLIAGSTTIGDRVVASGGTMINDHVNVCSDVYLMHRAGVVKDIDKPGMYAGGPVLPMKDYVKSNAIYGRLGELRQQVMQLSKMVAEKLGG